MQRRSFYVGRLFWQTVRRTVYVTPLILSYAFVCVRAGVFFNVPGFSGCLLHHVKTVSEMGIDFDVSHGECLGLIDPATPTVVTASQRGDLFSTKVFEYFGIANVNIERIDDRTIRISIPEKFGDRDRGIDVYEIYTQRKSWRGVNFVYDQAGPDEYSR